MSQKGVARNGETYCLECKSQVEREAERCPSCDSLLDEEVKAFSCPRCKTILPLGTSECPQCGMKFRAKAVRRISETAGGFIDAFHSKRNHSDETAEETNAQPEAESIADGEASESLSAEQLGRLQQLVGSLDGLGEKRSDLLSRMEQRHAEEKNRLSQMKGVGSGPPRIDLVEAEVLALADEIADVAELHSTMLTIADEISTLVESFEVRDEVKERGLAAKAMRLAAGAGGSDDAQLKAREDQLAKREEMVDRKIRGYASKRKELEDREEELSAKIERLKIEESSFEAKRKAISDGEEASKVESDQLRQKEAGIVKRLYRLSSVLDGRAHQSETDETGGTIESALSLMETSIKNLLLEKSDAEGKLREVAEYEKDLTRLLKALDQMLGQLPETAIDKFTQSDDYKLYEKTLERYGI